MGIMNSFMMLVGALPDYTTIAVVCDVLIILMVLLSVATIVVVMMQKGTSNNIGAIGGDSETYMGKNKGHNKERSMKILTCVLGGLFVSLSIIYFVLKSL